MVKSESIDIKLSQNPEDIIRVMRTISRFYNNSVLSVIREYTVNALDEHRKHNIDKKVEVSLPTKEYPFFTVRDYANGLSREALLETFVHVGASSRRDNVEETGGLGYGSKAGLGYADKFIIESYTNGKHLHLDVQMNPPTIHISDMGESAEPSGLLIVVESKPNDIKKFEEESIKFFAAADLNKISIDWKTSKNGRILSRSKLFWLPSNYEENPQYVSLETGSEKLGWVKTSTCDESFIAGNQITIAQAFGPRFTPYASLPSSDLIATSHILKTCSIEKRFEETKRKLSIIEALTSEELVDEQKLLIGESKEAFLRGLSKYLQENVVFIVGETPYQWGELFDSTYLKDRRLALLFNFIPNHIYNKVRMSVRSAQIDDKTNFLTDRPEFVVNLPPNAVEVLENREIIRDTENNRNILKESFIFFIENIRNAFSRHYQQITNDAERFNFFISNNVRLPEYVLNDDKILNYVTTEGISIPLLYEDSTKVLGEEENLYINENGGNQMTLASYKQYLNLSTSRHSQNTRMSCSSLMIAAISYLIPHFSFLNRPHPSEKSHLYIIDVDKDISEISLEQRDKIVKAFKRDLFYLQGPFLSHSYPHIAVIFRYKYANIEAEKNIWKTLLTNTATFLSEDDLDGIKRKANQKRKIASQQKSLEPTTQNNIVKGYYSTPGSYVNGRIKSKEYDNSIKYFTLTLEDIANTDDEYIASFKKRTQTTFFKSLMDFVAAITKTDCMEYALLLPINKKQEEQVIQSYPGAENIVTFVQSLMKEFIEPFECTPEEAAYSASYFVEGPASDVNILMPSNKMMNTLSHWTRTKDEIKERIISLNEFGDSICDPNLKQYLKIIEYFDIKNAEKPELNRVYKMYMTIFQKLGINNVVLDTLNEKAGIGNFALKTSLNPQEYAALNYQMRILSPAIEEPISSLFKSVMNKKNEAESYDSGDAFYPTMNVEYIPALINPIYTQITSRG